jgi:hypothetical protein
MIHVLGLQFQVLICHTVLLVVSFFSSLLLSSIIRIVATQLRTVLCTMTDVMIVFVAMNEHLVQNVCVSGRVYHRAQSVK